jgi:hypothetical protein
MIIGQSGSGKSTSLRNFQPAEVSIINVSGKPLPFRNNLKPYNTDNYVKIETALKSAPSKTIVIDDATYLMTNEYMRMAKVNGYQKFTDMALNFWSLVQLVIKELPDDVTVYFMGHIESDTNGNEKFKTVGKMLDSTVTLEGLFSIVLKTNVNDGKYYFVTQTNGADTTKSPMGMFGSLLIDNDLKAVDAQIREYYGIKAEDKK